MPELELVWECEFQDTAHQCFEQQIPDLLFMNLRQLPVQMDPLLKPILSHHPGIIITSGYDPDDILNLPFPVVAYLQKPFSFEHFLASIEQYKSLQNLE